MASKVKNLPYNDVAERAVIGSCFLSKDALCTTLSALTQDDFYEGKHIILYRVLNSLFEKNITVDVLTVTEELINIKKLEEIGGVKYLNQCINSMVALSSLDYYINIVKDQSVLRKMLTAVREIDTEYKEGEIDDINDFIVKSENKFKDSIEKRRISSFKPMEEISSRVEKAIEHQQIPDEDNVVGVTTGYTKLNEITLGFKESELVVIAGRPGMGKTALALNFAYNVALRKNKPVAIFSCEMSDEDLGKRLIAMDSRVPYTNLLKGTFYADEKARVKSSVNKLKKAKIYIDDTSNINIVDLIAKSRQLQVREPELAMIVVDYLGLVTATGNKSDNRTEEVRKITAALKGLAKDLKIPVIVLSQLNRKVEQAGENKRPQPSDLRDSGSIEQDADMIFLMYREDYYKSKKDLGGKKFKDLNGQERKEMTRDQALREYQQNMARNDISLTEINVAKNRRGKVEECYLFFDKSIGRFDDPPAGFDDEVRRLMRGESE